MPSSRSPSPHGDNGNSSAEVSRLKRRLAALEREADEAAGVLAKKAP